MKTIYNGSYIKLVDQLREARVRAGLTQAQAAHYVGMSRAWIGKIERRELRLDVLHFTALCRAYGLHPGRLLDKLAEEPPDVDGSSFIYQPFASAKGPQYRRKIRAIRRVDYCVLHR